MAVIAGLDVGGAHLKVALVGDGQVIAVEQYVCPLWQGIDKLDAALKQAAPLITQAQRHAVTMTGELSDLFPDRKAGVETLVAKLAGTLGKDTQFWMGRRGFGSAESAREHHRDVGSTNFLATAELIARHHANALLIDFGSTTTDIIPIINGKPAPRGLTDAERQVTGELVYTGYTRTAVMGVTNRSPFKGQWVSLAREYLATMADVRRILGEPLDAMDLHATADGKGKSIPESVTRFARLLGRDAGEGTQDEWRRAAAYVREEQLKSVLDGVAQVYSALYFSDQPTVIAAGIGSNDVTLVASRLRLPCVSFGELIDTSVAFRAVATHSAPAVAVALLLGT